MALSFKRAKTATTEAAETAKIIDIAPSAPAPQSLGEIDAAIADTERKRAEMKSRQAEIVQRLADDLSDSAITELSTEHAQLTALDSGLSIRLERLAVAREKAYLADLVSRYGERRARIATLGREKEKAKAEWDKSLLAAEEKQAAYNRIHFAHLNLTNDTNYFLVSEVTGAGYDQTILAKIHRQKTAIDAQYGD